MTAWPQRTVAIDWTGAAGPRQRAIKLAAWDRDQPHPRLIEPPAGRLWGRQSVLDWLLAGGAGPGALVGFDLSFAPPFFDLDPPAYFPGTMWTAQDIPSLWAEVEARAAAAPNLEVGPLFDDPAFAGLFRRPRGPALGSGYRRFRRTEQAWNQPGRPRAETFFHLIGASQVGLASLTGMRLMHRLGQDRRFSFWPLEAAPDPARTVIVELFTRLFLDRAGLGRAKARDADTVNRALAAFGGAPLPPGPALDDHASDALISAAGMMQLAGRSALWAPPGLTPAVARCEGWVFGIA